MKTIIDLDILIRNFLNFKRYFRGEVYYAVKANHSPYILRTFRGLGIDGFDVSSTGEIQVVHNAIGHTRFLYTHPIKSSRSILVSYNAYGIRTYVVDSVAELQKLDDKFGVHPPMARDLLHMVAALGRKSRHKFPCRLAARASQCALGGGGVPGRPSCGYQAADKRAEHRRRLSVAL